MRFGCTILKTLLPVVIFLLLLGSTAAFGQQPSERQTHRLSLPNKNWSLDISLEGFTVLTEEVSASESTYNFNAGQFPAGKSSSPRMVSLAVRMQPAQLKGDAAALRDFAMKKAAKNDTVDDRSLKALAYGQIPLLSYVVDLAGMGLPHPNPAPTSKHKNLLGFFVKDDVEITIALSVLPFKKEDEALFYAILDSVKFVNNSPPSSSFDFYQSGKSLFLQSRYQEAIGPLSRAFELEQQKPQLVKSDWRKLVLELANAYGAVGNKGAFAGTLEYGLSRDPTYYRFHFTRARMEAAEGKLDETIAALEKAFQYQQADQASGIAEPLPDPLFDPAFERFQKDDKFRKAVKAMKK
jgi:tetratricopeptide (TPR) repeat protein